MNETEQSKTREKKHPANKVSGTNGEKILNTEVFHAQRHSIFNHRVAMLCYIYNANRRIFQVTTTDKVYVE